MNALDKGEPKGLIYIIKYHIDDFQWEHLEKFVDCFNFFSPSYFKKFPTFKKLLKNASFTQNYNKKYFENEIFCYIYHKYFIGEKELTFNKLTNFQENNYAYSHYEIGKYYLSENSFEKALDYFDRAFQNGIFKSKFKIGLIYLKTNEDESALQSFSDSMSLFYYDKNLKCLHFVKKDDPIVLKYYKLGLLSSSEASLLKLYVNYFIFHSLYFFFFEQISIFF